MDRPQEEGGEEVYEGGEGGDPPPPFLELFALTSASSFLVLPLSAEVITSLETSELILPLAPF